jgi:hypothetical protein
MFINASELLIESIQPTLAKLDVHGRSPALLLLGTAAQETLFHFHLKHEKCDADNGLGLYQITHQCHWNLWDNFLAYQPERASTVRGFASQHTFLDNPDAELTSNLNYATAIAWFIYVKAGITLPNNPSIKQLAMCWRDYYPHQRKVSAKEFILNYETQIDGVIYRAA